MIRERGEIHWHGPFGPLQDLTAAALLFARVSKIEPGHSLELEISNRSDQIQEARVTRDRDGVGYTIHLEVEEPADPEDPGQNGIL